MPWAYDAGEPYARKKHGWSEHHAGVKVGSKGLRVGCCPSGVTPAQAAVAVNNGLPYFDDPDRVAQPGEPPDRVFMVYDGVPYEARWTTRGSSLHAFPILPELFEKMPDVVKQQLKARAKQQGYDIGEWLAKWAR